MASVLARFAKEELGATAVEYALLAGIIAIGIIASVGGIRDALNDQLNNATTEISR
jgi:pilus assembly protein Flp/PilA